MRITDIQLKNFKRFTDLMIRDIPRTAKLVVVVGPNGCGKSSLFDALLQWYRQNVGLSFNQDVLYYRKDAMQQFGWRESVVVSLADGETPKRGSLYVRTAYRNDPDFAITGITRPTVPTDNVRINRVIENDQTVSENYQRLVYDTMAGVYDEANNTKSVRALREELIGAVRISMKSVFGDLILNSIADPLGAGAFYFEKGESKSYHYKNLSGGEKAAFDILLDLHMKKKFYENAVYCVDELETHLHTRVQGALLKEMVKIIPDTSQLWVTTHSLGVLRAAEEMAVDDPQSVCIIDFDAVDPDVPREIVPSRLGRISWEKLLSIAIDDLSQRIAPRVVVVCEGSSVGSRRKDFDAEIYNRIFGEIAPHVLFVSGGASTQVTGSGISIRETLCQILPGAKVVSLVDRDDKSPNEVDQYERAGNLVLSFRNIESYLLADDVIEALVSKSGRLDLLAQALDVKRGAVDASVARGNSSDDLKSAAGPIYVELKRLLSLQRCGNNSDTFLRDTLAPLITPNMQTFSDLKQAVIDRLRS
ncbi:MAG: AAA family ATPase [Burkholderiaceae bacterium]